LLNDPKANRVRGVAKLNKKDARSETGLFLLEGLQGLKEALDRPKLIREIFATGVVISANPDIFAKAAAARVEVVEVTEQVLAALADTRTPQGVVAVCEQAHVSFEDVLAAEPKLLALLANIRDPGNAGTVLRAADAAGGTTLPELEQSILAKPTLWMFGNEAWGFEPHILELADLQVAVPIYGAAESLNLATAASICLYATAFAQNR
jgi:TrmH family RNA methyltransferase